MSSLATLAPILERPERSLLVVDFDGTLAPIVVDPAAARPLPEGRDALARLAARLGRVAVVSGRPVGFLRAVLDLPGVVLIGQYGLERLDGGDIVVDPRAAPHTAGVTAAAGEAERVMPALTVERKGDVAVTLHWRRAPEIGEEALALGRRLAGEHGLAAQPGRLALELRPPVAVDKGTAVAELAGGFEAAVMAGDDHGDLAAFSALDRLLSEGLLAHVVRVAVRSAEAPPALLEVADLVVDGPEDFARLLSDLADALG